MASNPVLADFRWLSERPLALRMALVAQIAAERPRTAIALWLDAGLPLFSSSSSNLRVETGQKFSSDIPWASRRHAPPEAFAAAGRLGPLALSLLLIDRGGAPKLRQDEEPYSERVETLSPDKYAKALGQALSAGLPRSQRIERWAGRAAKALKAAPFDTGNALECVGRALASGNAERACSILLLAARAPSALMDRFVSAAAARRQGDRAPWEALLASIPAEGLARSGSFSGRAASKSFSWGLLESVRGRRGPIQAYRLGGFASGFAPSDASRDARDPFIAALRGGSAEFLDSCEMLRAFGFEPSPLAVRVALSLDLDRAVPLAAALRPEELRSALAAGLLDLAADSDPAKLSAAADRCRDAFGYPASLSEPLWRSGPSLADAFFAASGSETFDAGSGDWPVWGHPAAGQPQVLCIDGTHESLDSGKWLLSTESGRRLRDEKNPYGSKPPPDPVPRSCVRVLSGHLPEAPVDDDVSALRRRDPELASRVEQALLDLSLSAASPAAEAPRKTRVLKA